MRTILEILDRSTNAVMVFSKRESLRRIRGLSQMNFGYESEDYYSGSVGNSVGRLRRKGLVEVLETEGGIEVKITDKGRTEVLKYRLGDLKLKPQGKWDKKWRLVLFDVPEDVRKKRNDLRVWLTRLGLRQLQKSVWVYPYPLDKEIRFLREVLGVPHAVKLITAEPIENDGELREIFDL